MENNKNVQKESKPSNLTNNIEDSKIGWILNIVSILFPVVALIHYMRKKDFNNKLGYWICLALGAALNVGFIMYALIALSKPGSLLFIFNLRQVFCLYFAYLMVQAIAYTVWAHYFKAKAIDEYQEQLIAKPFNILKVVFYWLIVAFALGFVYLLDSLVVSFPKGVPFDSFDYYGTSNIWVTFYAICILVGAIVSYLIASHNAHKAGYSKSYFEPILYVGFPAGIVGGRIWWVISEWNRSLADRHTFMDVINIRGGGLAIQGGVILGALAGIWIMREFRRDMSLFDAFDYIIPGILIAQAIGRYGNFFNIEVYGAATDPAKWWFLPKVFITHTQALDGSYYVPLFLIESCANILGFFVITKLFGGVLKKFMVKGDQGYLYFVWYGIVRVVMEPLRDAEFIMGTSVQMSIAFIVVGLLLIVCNHLYDFMYRKNKEKINQGFDNFKVKLSALASKFESMPKYVRILLALPIIDGFAYGYYRFTKGHFYTGILHIIFGSTILWVVDLLGVLLDTPLLFTRDFTLKRENKIQNV